MPEQHFGLAASFMEIVLDNPVYCGKLAYGRRPNERVQSTWNLSYRPVAGVYVL